MQPFSDSGIKVKSKRFECQNPLKYKATSNMLRDFKKMHLLSLMKRYVHHSEILVFILTKFENYLGVFGLKFSKKGEPTREIDSHWNCCRLSAIRYCNTVVNRLPI